VNFRKTERVYKYGGRQCRRYCSICGFIAPVSTSHKTEMPEIITDSYKGRSIQMFAGATITGNVTINFTEFELNQ